MSVQEFDDLLEFPDVELDELLQGEELPESPYEIAAEIERAHCCKECAEERGMRE